MFFKQIARLGEILKNLRFCDVKKAVPDGGIEEELQGEKGEDRTTGVGVRYI